MKTLLRDKITGLYFQGVNDWTSDTDKAFDFRFIDRAVHFAKIHSLMNDLELAFVFEDPDCVTSAPLESARVNLD